MNSFTSKTIRLSNIFRSSCPPKASERRKQKTFTILHIPIDLSLANRNTKPNSRNGTFAKGRQYRVMPTGTSLQSGLRNERGSAKKTRWLLMGKRSLLKRSGSYNMGRYLCRQRTGSLHMEVCSPIPLLQRLESTNKPAPSPKTPDGVVVRTPPASIASLDQTWCGGLSLTWSPSLPWFQFTKLLNCSQNQGKIPPHAGCCQTGCIMC